MITVHGKTDPGQVHRKNEDSLFVHSDLESGVAFFAVADGVGGNKNGEVASGLFVDAVSRRLMAHEHEFAAYSPQRDKELRDRLLQLMERLVAEAGAEVYEAAHGNPSLNGMNTTGVVMALVDQGMFVANVGDSRAYLLRGEKLYQLTEDHTMFARALQEGLVTLDQKEDFPFAGVLTRAFGSEPMVDIDTLFVRTLESDRFVLCSDGMYQHVGDEQLVQLSRANPRSHAMAECLVSEANRGGGTDNITVVVADVTRQFDSTQAVELPRQLRTLQSFFLFHDLTDVELMRVLRIVYTLRIGRGEVVIQEGNVGNELFMLVDGQVDATLQGEKLATLTAGNHFGELSLIDDQRRSATIIAVTDVVLLTISRQDFVALITDEPVLANKLLWSFLKNVSKRVRVLSVQVKGLQQYIAASQTASSNDE